MKIKLFFLILLTVPLFAILELNENAISNLNNIAKIDTNSFSLAITNIVVNENIFDEQFTNSVLKGELKKKSYTHSQQMQGCKPYITCRSSKIRSHGKTVGKVKTHKTSIGVKSVLYDANDNEIGSVHRVGNNTVYRDANGKRLTRREAKKLGLR